MNFKIEHAKKYTCGVYGPYMLITCTLCDLKNSNRSSTSGSLISILRRDI